MQNFLSLLPPELPLNVASCLDPADLNSLLHCSRLLSTYFTDVELQEAWLVRKYGITAALLQACQQGATAGLVSRLLAAPGLDVIFEDAWNCRFLLHRRRGTETTK